MKSNPIGRAVSVHGRHDGEELLGLEGLREADVYARLTKLRCIVVQINNQYFYFDHLKVSKK